MDVSIRHSRAPVRIDFTGGYTDVPPYSEENEGCIVNAAINLYAYSSLIPLDDCSSMRLISVNPDDKLSVNSSADLRYDGRLDFLKAALRLSGFPIRSGFEFVCRNEAPLGSGLGSSAARGVSMLGLLAANNAGEQNLAELAADLERKELGLSGGKQDCYAALYGGFSFLRFRDPAVSRRSLVLKSETVADLERNLILVYTHRSRVSGNLVDRVMHSYRSRVPRVTDAFHSLNQLALTIAQTLEAGRLLELGELLAEVWNHQKRLDLMITDPQLDEMVDEARKAGAIGGKTTGAGGGGCFVFYCRAGCEHEVIAIMKKMGCAVLKYSFDFGGLQRW